MLIIGIIAAIICFILAYLIWYKKQLWLISGYTDVNDKDKLAKYMGIFSIISGIYFFTLFAFINNINKIITVLSLFAFSLFIIIFRIFVYKKIK